MKRRGIAIAGTIILDKVYGISKYPSEGQLTKIYNITESVGGCVPNVGIDIRKIDSDIPVYAFGKIGNDSEGKFITEALSRNGIDTSGISATDTKTSFTDVMSIPGGQRTFFTYPGASAEFGYDDLDFDGTTAKMLHLGYFLLLDKVDAGDGVLILKEAQRRGIETSIDLVSENSDRYVKVLPALEYTDNLIINEIEAGMLTGIEPKNENLEKICVALKDYGVKKRIIIHKPDICVCLSDSGFTYVPSYSLPDGFIKGTTGAGDAFCAGALAKIHEGASDREILEFASGAAVTALSTPDATSGIATAAEIDKLNSILERKNICL